MAVNAGSAERYLPARKTLPALRAAANACRGCALYVRATQTVFGEGPPAADVMLVGEVPGDHEDREGKPFVGPAGRLLDAALGEAGVDRSRVYVTNAVKHFKWRPRGRKRIHEKPSWTEFEACRPWLEAELAVVRPKVIVCLGASAAQVLLGRQFRVTRDRGRLVESSLADHVLATVHPASILRLEVSDERRGARDLFVRDLKVVASVLDGRS